MLWYGLWLLGLPGLVLGLRRGASWWLLLAFAAFMLAGILAVPTKTRLLMPLVPVLCLGAGGLLDSLLARRRAAQGQSAGPG